MAVILQEIISKKENFCILIKISLNFVPEGPINNKSVFA